MLFLTQAGCPASGLFLLLHMTRFYPLCLLLALLPACLAAQTSDSDDIQVTAVFKNAIDLTITAGANVNFLVASQGDYLGGVSSPYNYFSDFEVSSSTNFQVSLSSTNFSDGEGRVLDARNFGYRLLDNGSHLAGVNHLLLGQASSPSPLAALGSNQVIVAATGAGNAGRAETNRFRIHFELGTADVRALSSLPTLLEQQIVPSTYTAVVTLTASAMP
jgi:hypothetical protein